MGRKDPGTTRKKIIDTALRLFLERGYEGASMNAISAESGITKGGIYHYFESKEHLFRVALQSITAQMDKWSSRQFRSVSTAEDLIGAVLGSIKSMRDAFSGIVREDHEKHPYSFLEVLISAARRDEGVRREMAAIYSQARDNMKALLLEARDRGEIRGEIDCDALALEINALMEGVMLLGVLDESMDLDAAGERVSRNIWTMIRA